MFVLNKLSESESESICCKKITGTDVVTLQTFVRNFKAVLNVLEIIFNNSFLNYWI